MSNRLDRLVRCATVSLTLAFLVGSGFAAGFATQRLAEVGRPAPCPEPCGSQAGETRAGLDIAGSLDTIVSHTKTQRDKEILASSCLGVRTRTADEMVYAAIRGAIQVLDDPYSAFAEPGTTHLVEEGLNGSFEGIGATVEKRDGRILIVAPLSGSPAERAGLRAGDVVLEVDGESLAGAELWEAIARIRGPRGTTVTLTVLRAGRPDPLLISVQRERINIQAVQAGIIRLEDTRIILVRLSRFSNNAPRQFKRVLRSLMAENPQGVILDLRDNPGGYLHVAVQIASEFMDEGLILTEVGRDDQRPHPALHGGLFTGSKALPLAVLVNRGSASASEIVAGALQDHRRGVLIGEATFGKGAVQVSHDLSDGSNMRLTTARWLTPAGRLIQGTGLEPDIGVPASGDQAGAQTDAQLERAIDYLVEQIQADRPDLSHD